MKWQRVLVLAYWIRAMRLAMLLRRDCMSLSLCLILLVLGLDWLVGMVRGQRLFGKVLAKGEN